MKGKSPFINALKRNMRLRGYSIRTEHTYVYWIVNFIRFHGRRHPKDMGKKEVVKYLEYLVNDRLVSSNTQRIALNALAFMYNKYLEQPLGKFDFIKSSRPRYLPTVLVQRVRVQDIDFTSGSVLIRNSKGNKDRNTLLSQSLHTQLKKQVEFALDVQKSDNVDGIGPSLPYSLGKKYPSAFKTTGWMFVLFINELLATRFGIALRHTCLRPAQTFARFRSYLVIPM